MTYLDDNIMRGHSLVDDTSVVGADAFNWHEQFPKIFDNGGFDVVIGNPPYIDSEEMVRGGLGEVRDYITDSYNFVKGNWDIYIAFFERGFSLINENGELCFISPDKWLAKPFGEALRAGLFEHISYICEVGREVFDDAKVDAIITKVTSKPNERIEVARLEGDSVTSIRQTLKSEIAVGEPLDSLFSPNLDLLKKIENKADELGSIALCENACATADAYKLKEIISDARCPTKRQPNQFKVANTGTLDRYVFKWGVVPMTYLKDKYLCPVVDKKQFAGTLGATYLNRARSPKIIIKGLTLLEGALDVNAEFVPGKSTLVITNEDHTILKYLVGVINSKVLSFYVKEKNRSSSYNQGVNFNPEMVNKAPVPKGIDTKGVADLSETATRCSVLLAERRKKIFSILEEDLGIKKYSKKMQKWPDISFVEFVEEIEKNVNMSVSKKSEWHDYFEKATGEAFAILHDLNKADASINKALYKAFDLTAREIEVVEQYR